MLTQRAAAGQTRLSSYNREMRCFPSSALGISLPRGEGGMEPSQPLFWIFSVCEEWGKKSPEGILAKVETLRGPMGL